MEPGAVSRPVSRGEDAPDSPWGMGDPPRIRSITGVRIRHLTLPQSLSLGIETTRDDWQQHGYFLDETGGMSLSASPGPSTLRRLSSSSRLPPSEQRRHSVSSIAGKVSNRDRSDSGATLMPGAIPASPPVQARTRMTRPRAPTLAGEAMEHERERAQGIIQEQAERSEAQAEVEEGDDTSERPQLSRCFITFRLPPVVSPRYLNGIAGTGDQVDVKGKARAADPPAKLRRNLSALNVNTRLSRSSSSGHIASPTTPTHLRLQDGESPTKEPGRSSLNMNGTLHTPPRSRTTSLGSRMPQSPSAGQITPGSPTAEAAIKLGQRPPRLVRAGSEAARTRPPARPTSMIARSSYRSPQLNGIPQLPEASAMSKETYISNSDSVSGSTVPFYISAIHPPSSRPSFPALSPDSDFANWLTVEELGTRDVVVEIWYEDAETGWQRAKDVGGRVDLAQLRRVEREAGLAENELEFSLRGDAKSWYRLPTSLSEAETEPGLADGGLEASPNSKARRASVRGVIERSVRETRMKKGVGIGSLHQLVHGQSVLADTKRNIELVKEKIDGLLRDDVDRRALRREVNERSAKLHWIQSKIDEVSRLSRQVEAEIVLRQKAISDRRADLVRAEDRDDVRRTEATRLGTAIKTAEDNRSALIPLIHHYRAHHIQALDALFPIAPLNPSILLYGILAIPLPIPAGKDPAPPLTLPPASLPEGVKVDERSTAAALGYVAMVVQILGNLGGSAAGGLVYPVLCAGSKSLVRDVVSVMQGPRSFPLYTKGVERYRFDYAVFLLNTNVELLMQEANIRLVDRRHTLPNLKALLLTLSSPIPPPPPPHPSIIAAASAGQRAVSGASTQWPSRATSRQTSYNYPLSASASGSTALPRKGGYSTPPSSVGGDGDYGYMPTGRSGEKESSAAALALGAMLAAASPGGPEGARRRRSHLSRPSWGGSSQGPGDDERDTEGSISEAISSSDMG